MFLTPTKKLPENFNQFLENIIQREAHYLGKYINEFLPLLNPFNYILSIQSPFTECLQDSYSGKHPSTFIISYRNDLNTYRQVTLLEYLEIDNLGKFERLIKKLIQYWTTHQMQEIIFDTPVPVNLFLDRILCPLSFQCIPRIMMVKELSKNSTLRRVNNKNIFMISAEDVPSALQCLMSAYRDTSWKNLHPEVRIENEGSKFIQNLLHLQKNTEIPLGLQYRLDNQCIGILLGNLIGIFNICLIHLAVHPSYRRKGIATLLLQRWSQLLRKKGIKNIFLKTHLDNPALKLYLKEEFHPLYAYSAFYCNLQKGKSNNEPLPH